MNNIKDLIFDKTYDGKYDCFTGRCDDQFMTGSNETGSFLIANYKNFNLIDVLSIQFEIEKRFKNSIT